MLYLIRISDTAKFATIELKDKQGNAVPSRGVEIKHPTDFFPEGSTQLFYRLYLQDAIETLFADKGMQPWRDSTDPMVVPFD